MDAIESLTLHAKIFEAETEFGPQKFKQALREGKSPAECYKAYAEDIDAFYRWSVQKAESSFSILMDIADEHAEEIGGGAEILPKITPQILGNK